VTQTGLLNPISANSIRLRTSIYEDDITMLIRPIASDINSLEQLLHSFGQATCLCTNIVKSEILPIRCEVIDLASILGQLHATITGTRADSWDCP
jgi:hypothetical protein